MHSTDNANGGFRRQVQVTVEGLSAAVAKAAPGLSAVMPAVERFDSAGRKYPGAEVRFAMLHAAVLIQVVAEV